MARYSKFMLIGLAVINSWAYSYQEFWSCDRQHVARLLDENNNLGLYDTDTNQLVGALIPGVSLFQFQGTEKYQFGVAYFQDKSLGLCDLKTMKVVQRLQNVTMYCIDNDNDKLVALIKHGSHPVVKLYNLQTLLPETMLFRVAHRQRYASLTPEDQLQIYNDELELITSFVQVLTCRWSKEGAKLILIFKNGEVAVWDFKSQELFKLENAVNCQFSDDEKKIVIGFTDGTLARYNATDMSLECWL